MSKFFKSIAAIIFFIPALVVAAPQVELKQIVEKEIVVVENNIEVTKRELASEIQPGSTLFYTMTYTNSGDEVATQVVIDSPVPVGTTYVLGSAIGDGTEVLVKLSKNTEYVSEANAKVTLKGGDEAPVVASDISALRWIVADIPPVTTGKVTFQVEVNK